MLVRINISIYLITLEQIHTVDLVGVHHGSMLDPLLFSVFMNDNHYIYIYISIHECQTDNAESHLFLND